MSEIDWIVEMPPGGVAAESVEVVWQETGQTLSPTARERIEEQWNQCIHEARQSGKTLFNAGITQLRRAAWVDGKLRLELTETDYKPFFVTCIRDHAWFAAHAPEAITPGLGNAALLTHAEQALLGIRSHNVSAYPGRAHLIGGVLEKLAPAATWRAIVDHLAQELKEEAGIEPAELPHTPRLLALVYEPILHQPEMIWQWETVMPLSEIARRLRNEEHDQPLIIQREQLPPEQRGTLTPVALAAWQLWNRSATIRRRPGPTASF